MGRPPGQEPKGRPGLSRFFPRTSSPCRPLNGPPQRWPPRVRPDSPGTPEPRVALPQWGGGTPLGTVLGAPAWPPNLPGCLWTGPAPRCPGAAPSPCSLQPLATSPLMLKPELCGAVGRGGMGVGGGGDATPRARKGREVRTGEGG